MFPCPPVWAVKASWWDFSTKFSYCNFTSTACSIYCNYMKFIFLRKVYTYLGIAFLRKIANSRNLLYPSFFPRPKKDKNTIVNVKELQAYKTIYQDLLELRFWRKFYQSEWVIERDPRRYIASCMLFRRRIEQSSGHQIN